MMLITELIKELETIKEQHGNIQVELQEGTTDLFPYFYIVPEEIENDDKTLQTWVRLRHWPY